MDYIWQGVLDSLRIITSCDREFMAAVSVSLRVALVSTLLATITGVPFGMWLAGKRSAGARALVTLLSTVMSLPTVVVGLMV